MKLTKKILGFKLEFSPKELAELVSLFQNLDDLIGTTKLDGSAVYERIKKIKRLAEDKN